MTPTCRLNVLLLVFGVFIGLAEAQQGTSSIRGRALDEQDAVLPGVSIVVTHQQTGIFRETVTGGDGVFVVTDLVPGPYRITAELQGFKTLTREDLLLTGGLTQTLDLKLEVGSVAENVTVTGQIPQVDVTATAIASNIDLRELQATPAINHNITGFLAVLPGVAYAPGKFKPSIDGVFINGQRENRFFVDGGANTGSSASWLNRVNVPSELVQEVVLFTSQVPAEYGGFNGAAVNTITKQGTNAFRGSVYGYYVDDSWVAADYLVERNRLVTPKTDKKQLGATLGGPLFRNKLFFFGMVERSIQSKSSSAIYPSNPEHSFTTRGLVPGTQWFLRVDHQINADNTYAVRYLERRSSCDGNPTCRSAVGDATIPGSAGETLSTLAGEREWDPLLVANYNKVMGSRKLNVFTFSAPMQTTQCAEPYGKLGENEGYTKTQPPTLRYLSFDTQANYCDGRTWEEYYRLDDAFSWMMGSHSLKFGGNYVYMGRKLNRYNASNGIFAFPSNRPFNAADPSTYPERLWVRASPQFVDPGLHWGGFFVQDKWQWKDQLTLNLGLRYDVEVIKIPTNEFNPLFTDRTKTPMDWNNVQPRAGFAYASSDGKAVFRGGYGMFTVVEHLGRVSNLVSYGVFGQGHVLSFPADRPDPGPSSGRLPTDPFLVNGPVLNRALLEQLYPPDTLIRNDRSVVYLDNPDRKLATGHQTTIGYEREFLNALSFAADYFHIWTNGVPVQYDVNPGLRATTSRTAAITRVDLHGIANSLGIFPFGTAVLTFKHDGQDRYDGLNLSLEKRFATFWSARTSYTLGRSRNNYDASNNFQVLADHNLTWGPSNNDRTHVFNASGTVEVPRTGGLLATGIYRYMSGSPFTITNSNFDVNRNGILVDPLPAGTYRGAASASDAFTIENRGGWNGARGPSFHEVDFRLGYRFQLGGGRTLEASLEGFNIMNEPNHPNPSGDQRQPTFLIPNQLSVLAFERQFQLSVRMTF